MPRNRSKNFITAEKPSSYNDTLDQSALPNLHSNWGSFIMFHWVKGVPFDFNSGAYDGLTLWEQIDNGAQYTPAKKYLTAVPIVLFLLSTHYTHYDVFTFLINFAFLLIALIAKLPQLHKVRLFGINKLEAE
ncbi:13056_t:CDS:2 [Entrophospora sp. SA101]|nr:13056_t:CDS:2 [Entrophospora sp. SA101]